jgi:hypothetical protein
MKKQIILACLCLSMAGCAGYVTSLGVAYEYEGRRVEGNASFTPVGKSGKQVVKLGPRVKHWK